MIPKKVYITFAVWNNNRMCEFIDFREEPIDYKQAYGDNDAQTIEYINLSQVWHGASEEPKEYPILCQDDFDNVWVQYSLKDYVDGWVEFSVCECVTQWAYISGLLPRNTFSNEKSE